MPSRIPTPPAVARIPIEPAADESPHLAEGTRDFARAITRVGTDSERVGLIVHDLKTPLSIIMLETQLLAERLAGHGPMVQLGLQRIAQNAAYIDRLIADLLDLASAEADQLALQLHRERVDLAALVRQAVDRAVSSGERGRVQVAAPAPVHVHADRNRLERVISNLIGNALKYSRDEVTVTVAGRGRCARVTVIDRGPGLTTEQASTIFDRYQRATRGRGGHGLGLYISRMIIDAHAGLIGVTTTPGAGSQFFFELDAID